jgi:hypothetical protein
VISFANLGREEDAIKFNLKEKSYSYNIQNKLMTKAMDGNKMLDILNQL